MISALNMHIRIVAITLLVSCLGVCGAGKFSFIGKDQHGFTFDQKVEILRLHNEERRSSQASNMNQLFWHMGLQNLSQTWADNCDYNHNRQRHGIPGFPYNFVGENLFLTNSLSNYKFLTSWIAEKNNFVPNSTCKPGKMCGHYAQMLWHDTETVGCGVRYCDPVTGSSIMTAGFLVVCDYGPLGNKPNEPIMNRGTACTECPEGRICVHGLCAPPNCNDVECQNGELVQDVCMCNCSGSGYDGEFCESGTGSGSDTDSGSDTSSAGGGGSNTRDLELLRNVTFLFRNKAGKDLLGSLVWRYSVCAVCLFLGIHLCHCQFVM